MKLNGLILCGGKSSRLGIPKYKLHKNGIPLYRSMLKLLEPICKTVYISCRQDQIQDLKHAHILCDQNSTNGPLEGLYQAFVENSKSDWLIIAVDLVYITFEDIELLVKNQDETYQAICLNNPETNEPYPLFAIYNASIFKNLIAEYNSKLKSAKRLLMESKIKTIPLEDSNILKGINTVEDLNKWNELQAI
ncbi:MAG: molybdenum cofactor guanylyltransferase [Saprospiraceae bacterium]|nr:molybdenum cofactor guanylyltransferase [Saprospiraceae bacterium]MBK9221716.1 molybdenum cofactor guanylyltransferase [Saprospiraceae bacterium]MBK9721347.1 molybdenum cofactor guanylyltransferase [Saprospiraceae bacterium]